MSSATDDLVSTNPVVDEGSSIEEPTTISDGSTGTSTKLTQGEIIFVSIATIIAVMGILVGIYLYQRRKKRIIVEEQKELNNTKDDEESPTVIECPPVVQQKQAPLAGGGGQQHQQHPRRMSSAASGTSSNEHHHRQQQRRQSRRYSNGSNTGSDYKMAAIDHMQHQISRGY